MKGMSQVIAKTRVSVLSTDEERGRTELEHTYSDMRGVYRGVYELSIESLAFRMRGLEGN